MSTPIGRSIEVLRAARGWDVTQLAQKAGIGRTTLYRIVRRGAEPSMSTLRRIASAFGLPPELLMSAGSHASSSTSANPKGKFSPRVKSRRVSGGGR